MIYCISCKKKTNDNNIKPKMTKNNKPYIIANCSVCKKLKSRFLLVSVNLVKAHFKALLISIQHKGDATKWNDENMYSVHPLI